MHCSNLAADALHLAIQDYLVKSGREVEVEQILKALPKVHESLVALSGGVDSAVAALRLIGEGRSLETATVRLWPGSDRRSCCSPGALQRAARTAAQLGVPHHVLDLEAEFEDVGRRAVLARLPGRRDAQPVRRLQPHAPGGARGPRRRAGPGARRHRPLRAPRVARRRALRGARRGPRQGPVVHAVGGAAGGARATGVPARRARQSRRCGRPRDGRRPRGRGRAREPGGVLRRRRVPGGSLPSAASSPRRATWSTPPASCSAGTRVTGATPSGSAAASA